MENTTGQILKNTDVELNGHIHIDIAKNTPSQIRQQPNQANAPVTKPKAIVVENSPDSVVIEFTCSCGRKTYLQCEIANNQQPK